MVNDDFYQLLTNPNLRERADREYPFVPLDAPGMPLPGPDFIAAAVALGDNDPTAVVRKAKRLVTPGPWLSYLYRRALYDANFRLQISVRGIPQPAELVPGHLYADTTAEFTGGPRPARVMIIGKNPGAEEVQEKTNFVGPTSEVFFDILHDLGLGMGDYGNWYFTNMVKWQQLDRQSDTIPRAWVQDCRVLLEEEIRLVQPDYILCLGSDASRALLGPTYTVSTMSGRVMSYMVPLHADGEPPRYHTCKVMTAVHPAAVFRKPELSGDFSAQLSLFMQLAGGADVGGVETDIHHECVYTQRRLHQIVDEIRNDPEPDRRIIAIDAEWHGDYPTEPGAYLRTIQFSSKHKEAYCVVLRHQGGEPAFQPSIRSAIGELERLLKYDPAAGYYPRIGGWFLRADLPWLIHSGLDLREEYAPAPSVEECKTKGGWDGSLMYHAVHESASYKLEDVATRMTHAPRWDGNLQVWRKQYVLEQKLKEADLDGYGMCPEWILHPYGCYDVDATRRIAMRCMDPNNGSLFHDWNGNDSWLPYWTAHSASLAFLEMEMTGIILDKNRVRALTELFTHKRDDMLADYRCEVNWPEFNPESTQQCVALLFGDQYLNKRDKATNAPRRIRPEGALCFNKHPIKTTGHRPRLWADIVSRNETAFWTPSTDREVLGILGHRDPMVMRLRDLKFMQQVLESILREPKRDNAGNIIVGDDGFWVYRGGLSAEVHRDGRIRTHLFQTKETGRASSARPPLQNLSKRREDDYSRILGDDYLYPLRTVLRAGPGCVLVEADLIGAELAVLAWLSGDPTMTDHVRRANLPESDPNYYNMHAQTAIRVFRLQCTPTKNGLKEAGHKGLYVAAKNVNFGIPYGRSAEAISRQCREEGVDITVSDTQAIVDYYFSTYMRVGEFLAECRHRSQNEGWLRTPAGRYRRFIHSRERSIQSEQERQAQNFLIQSYVADHLNIALRNLLCYRVEHPEVVFRFVLQIHDAILLEVPVAHVSGAVAAMHECMVARAPVWPTRPDGSPLQVVGPYRFGIDTEVCLNWGEHITEAQAAAIGLDTTLI